MLGTPTLVLGIGDASSSDSGKIWGRIDTGYVGAEPAAERTPDALEVSTELPTVFRGHCPAGIRL